MGIDVKARKGQALTELIVGMFTLSLVTMVLCAFAIGIAKSLHEQNMARGSGGSWEIKSKIELPDDLWKVF